MPSLGPIVRRLLSGAAETTEQGRELQQLLTPDPHAPPPNHETFAAQLRAGREPALAAILAALLPERIARHLGGDEAARAHADSILNEPFPAGAALSKEFLDAQTARIQALEACVRSLALALVEFHFPSPRQADTVFHSTASRRR